MYSYGPPHMAKQKQDDQPELTYSSYVRTLDVTQKTSRRWWMIGRSGERGSGISVLAARHDDDDIYIIIIIISNSPWQDGFSWLSPPHLPRFYRSRQVLHPTSSVRIKLMVRQRRRVSLSLSLSIYIYIYIYIMLFLFLCLHCFNGISNFSGYLMRKLPL